jgi:hypothetical protein
MYELVVNKTISRDTLKKLYRVWAKEHPNIMTPEITNLFYNKLNKEVIIELSRGKGIDTPILYGVSIFKYIKEEKTFKKTGLKDLSKCFSTHEEAYSYAQELIKIELEESGTLKG